MIETYFTLGYKHIIDLNGYDHMLFIAVLISGISPRQWKEVLYLITAFTLGHSLTLALGVLRFNFIPSDWIEFLIPITILLTALSNLISKRIKLQQKYSLTALFGLVHGLGFAGYLSVLLPEGADIWQPLLFFNIGVEIGQIAIASVIIGTLLLLSLITKNAVRIAQMSISAVGLGISLFLTIHNWPF